MTVFPLYKFKASFSSIQILAFFSLEINRFWRFFQVTWSLLERLPQTRLGRLRKCRNEEEILTLADSYNAEKNEFRFERQPRNFNCILNFLHTGKLHLGEETCVIAFSQVGH